MQYVLSSYKLMINNKKYSSFFEKYIYQENIFVFGNIYPELFIKSLAKPLSRKVLAN